MLHKHYIRSTFIYHLFSSSMFAVSSLNTAHILVFLKTFSAVFFAHHIAQVFRNLKHQGLWVRIPLFIFLFSLFLKFNWIVVKTWWNKHSYGFFTLCKPFFIRKKINFLSNNLFKFVRCTLLINIFGSKSPTLTQQNSR